ncbi:MAG: Ig-like domain-containing protein [bacterium]
MKSFIIYAIALFAVLCLNCNSEKSNPVDTTDKSPPNVSVVSPYYNQVISDSITIIVDVRDNIKVEKVEFYIDGDLRLSRALSPWEYKWYFPELADNSVHTIFVLAYDAMNNIGSSSLISVTIKNSRPPIDIRAYGQTFDSLYTKTWSDNSWEKFKRYETISGYRYIVMEINGGDLYYYNENGYCGFTPHGESRIMFDIPIPYMKNLWKINDSQKLSTTFHYQGYTYTFNMTYTFKDTLSVTVSFGTFNPCLYFLEDGSLSAQGQSTTTHREFYQANGPGAIKGKTTDGRILNMVRGHVNGKYWGTAGEIASKVNGERYNSPQSLIHLLQNGIGCNLILPNNYKYFGEM